MARWLVYAMVFMQAAFLVFSQDGETQTVPTEAAANSAVTSTPTSSVVPTRTSAPSTTKPPLIHNNNTNPPPKATETVPKITTRHPDSENAIKNATNTKEKSGASSPTTYNQIVMGSIVGIILFSAI